MKITLIGAGMGAPGMLTVQAREALLGANVIIGAERLLADLSSEYSVERVVMTAPEKIAAAIASRPDWGDVCVLLSGDVGFHSGATRLFEVLEGHAPEVLCGISSPQYFASRLRRPWQDFHLVSAHGVRRDVVAEALNHPAVLFLVGGETSASSIAADLCAAGLDECRLTVGENLSASNERIISATAREAMTMAFASLCVVLVENNATFTREARSAGIADGEFVRGRVPMTKREVRAVVLSLLEPALDSVLYDIGSGTGSVAVEMALAARRGTVHAIERDPGGVELMAANRDKFGVRNVRIVSGVAPEALAPLPAPDAVFIGGSGGMMRAIVAEAVRKNPAVRLVASAVSLETLSEAVAAFGDAAIGNVDVCQIAASRAVARGGYHMLEGMNPVFLISGGGTRGR